MRVYVELMALAVACLLCGCIADGESGRSAPGPRRESLGSALEKSGSASGSHLVAGRSGGTADGGAGHAGWTVEPAAQGGSGAAVGYGGGRGRGELAATCYYLHADDRYTESVVGIGPQYRYNDLDGGCSLGLYVAYEIYELKQDTDLSRGIRDYHGLTLGFEGRKYVNRAAAYVSPFVSVGLGFGMLDWRYANPLQDRATGEVIEGDGLPYVQGSCCVGVEFGRTYALKPSIQAGVFGRGYGTETEQGFVNDILKGSAGCMVSAALGFQF